MDAFKSLLEINDNEEIVMYLVEDFEGNQNLFKITKSADLYLSVSYETMFKRMKSLTEKEFYYLRKKMYNQW